MRRTRRYAGFFFFEVLAEHGLNQEAYEALNKRTEPSFGHRIELGSTTSREKWDTTGSHNHPMFGGGLVWFYRNLAGMQADPWEPGYRHMIFKPQPVDELEYVTYSNRTPYGEGGITWKNSEGSFSMDVTGKIYYTRDNHMAIRISDPRPGSGGVTGKIILESTSPDEHTISGE